jgi:hypothetical protein
MVQTRRSTTDSKTADCDWELGVTWACPAADGEPNPNACSAGEGVPKVLPADDP